MENVVLIIDLSKPSEEFRDVVIEIFGDVTENREFVDFFIHTLMHDVFERISNKYGFRFISKIQTPMVRELSIPSEFKNLVEEIKEKINVEVAQLQERFFVIINTIISNISEEFKIKKINTLVRLFSSLVIHIEFE